MSGETAARRGVDSIKGSFVKWLAQAPGSGVLLQPFIGASCPGAGRQPSMAGFCAVPRTPTPVPAVPAVPGLWKTSGAASGRSDVSRDFTAITGISEIATYVAPTTEVGRGGS